MELFFKESKKCIRATLSAEVLAPFRWGSRWLWATLPLSLPGKLAKNLVKTCYSALGLDFSAIGTPKVSLKTSISSRLNKYYNPMASSKSSICLSHSSMVSSFSSGSTKSTTKSATSLVISSTLILNSTKV